MHVRVQGVRAGSFWRLIAKSGMDTPRGSVSMAWAIKMQLLFGRHPANIKRRGRLRLIVYDEMSPGQAMGHSLQDMLWGMGLQDMSYGMGLQDRV